MTLFAALAPLAVATASPGALACNPIPGWDAVLASAATRVIVLGEVHGSNEMLQAFADALCLTAQSRRVVAAVEQPEDCQPEIDQYIESDGGEAAQAALRTSVMWQIPMKDGRSSEAFFRLFETLRQMRAAGAIERVVAFQPGLRSFASRPAPEAFEKAMADRVVAGSEQGATVVALVGNIHAMLTPVPWEPRYLPMAAHLPGEQVVTLNLIANGGETWACRTGPGDCGPKPAGPPLDHARGVDLTPTRGGAYSGVLYLGMPTTASPPQQGMPLPG